MNMGKGKWLFWGMATFTVLAALGLVLVTQLLGSRVDRDTVWMNFPVPEFTLTNQDGRVVTLAELRGKVWVADIVFTRCTGPCPVITKQMSDLQAELLKDDRVKFVTLTTDPEFDTPKVMQQFGERFNANFGDWFFLTGTKKEIARVAVDGLKLVAVEKAPAQRENPEDLFIHSTRFVVVDKAGVMRAALESTDPQVAPKLARVIKKLLRQQD